MSEVHPKPVETIEALEGFEPTPFVPPSWAAGAILLLTLGSAAVFVAIGIARANDGWARLTASLLEVRQPEPLSEQSSLDRGSALPFELETLEGARVRLSDLGDKTIFLNFWATWCPPCVEEMPSLRRLHQKMKDHPDFEFLAVSADEGWGPVRKFFERNPPAFSVALDPKGQVARQYGTTKFPETYVIKNGKIVGYIVGPRDWDHWFAEAWLLQVLKEGV